MKEGVFPMKVYQEMTEGVGRCPNDINNRSEGDVKFMNFRWDLEVMS